VKVVAARRLVEVDGGDCNPFAVVTCNKAVEQTMVANRTTEPEWNSAIMIFTGIGKSDADHVVATVMHKNLSVQADVELGRAFVDLRTVVLSPSIESDAWYDLQPSPGTTHEVSGQIRIECTYFISDTDDILPEQDDVEMDDEVTPPPNMLFCTIIRGRSLYLGRRESVDAYVTLKVGLKKRSTPVARRNSNPHWDCAFKLPVSDGSAMVVVKVKDHGVLRNRLIGTCMIPMVEVAAYGDTGFIKWCPLHGIGGIVDDQVCFVYVLSNPQGFHRGPVKWSFILPGASTHYML
jgi:Ca2+-dependent lipid-binding protein